MFTVDSPPFFTQDRAPGDLVERGDAKVKQIYFAKRVEPVAPKFKRPPNGRPFFLFCVPHEAPLCRRPVRACCCLSPAGFRSRCAPPSPAAQLAGDATERDREREGGERAKATRVFLFFWRAAVSGLTSRIPFCPCTRSTAEGDSHAGPVGAHLGGAAAAASAKRSAASADDRQVGKASICDFCLAHRPLCSCLAPLTPHLALHFLGPLTLLRRCGR